MTCLDKIKQVEKVAESYLRFETVYAAPIRSVFNSRPCEKSLADFTFLNF